MSSYLVKTLIIKHSHQRGIGRCPVGLRNLQLPFLLLTRRQAVTEGLPRHHQSLIRHRTSDGMLMDMALTILHPSIGQQQAVAILLFISKFTINQFTILIDAATFQQFVTRIDRIDDMQVRIAGTHLNGNGLAIAWELAMRRIEPVISLHGRLLVVKSEHYELHVHLVVPTFCLQAVFAAF